MSSPENPYASPADLTPDDAQSEPAQADAALIAVASEFRRCLPWLLALIVLLTLLAFFNAISSLVFLREVLSYGIVFLAIAGLYLLLAAVAWGLRGASLEFVRKPTVAALTNTVLRSRTVYTFCTFLLLFPAILLGAFAALAIISALKWFEWFPI